MNERILELVKQVDPSFGNNQKWVIVGEADIEKFTELIVKECVGKCKTDWYGDSLDDVCVQMLEHFGVE